MCIPDILGSLFRMHFKRFIMSDYRVKAKQVLFGSNIYSFWCLISKKIVKIERYSAFYLKMYFRLGQVIIRIIYIFST